MSQSTDAILFYGILIPDDEECPFGEWDDFDDVYLNKAGLRGEPSFKKEKAEWTKWLDEKNEMRDKMTIQFFSHCSIDAPMWAMSAVKFTANRGHPHTFEGGVGAIETGMKERNRIQKTCELMGIKFQEPAWHLVSDWS